jgi:methylmalonyl-CoA mutase
VSAQVPADVVTARERWRTAVARRARRDPRELGDQPERLLDTPTYEGFPIAALYTAWDELPEPPLPGEWPFVRGTDSLRDVNSGWKVVETFPSDGAEDNAAVLAALGDGVSALMLRVGESGVAPTQLERLLRGVYLDVAPVMLDAGADYFAACEALLALVAQRDPDKATEKGPAQRVGLWVDLGGDPLTAPLSGRGSASIEEVVAIATRVAGECGVRAITIDGPAFHNVGANAAWELAGSLAAAVTYLRVLGQSGMPVADALRQISFRLVADDLGEHAAHYAGRLRCRCRRRRHRVGTALRCGDPRRSPRNGEKLRAAHRPQHPVAAAGRVTCRPGVGPGRWIMVRRGSHRTAGSTGLAVFPGCRAARRIR